MAVDYCWLKNVWISEKRRKGGSQRFIRRMYSDRNEHQCRYEKTFIVLDNETNISIENKLISIFYLLSWWTFIKTEYNIGPI